MVSEVAHAAKDLAATVSRLTERFVTKAEAVSKDPTGAARKAARRAADELDAAAKEIDRVLKQH
ncbi:MAG: hypothetical protein ACYDFT_00115 [Thermoplasmata archaeon]